MDAKLPSGDEILALAESMEEKGMYFYRKMAQKFCENNEIAAVFEKLAEDEIEHRALFQSFRHEDHMELKINPETVKYIKTILHPDLFPTDEAGLAELVSPKMAIGIGIEAEKAAILFYQELYDAIEDKEDRKTISKLLKEEKMHLVELRDFWDEL